MAGVGGGNFHAEPLPGVRMRSPNPFWHVGKILHQQFWLRRHFRPGGVA
jgi:hypothetical protein